MLMMVFDGPWAKAHGVNLAGFMIGNGCPGWDVLTCTPYSARARLGRLRALAFLTFFPM